MDGVAAHRVRRRRLAAALLLVVCLSAGVFAAWRQWRAGAASLPAGISRQEYDRTREELFDRLGRRPQRIEVLAALGKSAARRGKPELALACFRDVPSSNAAYGPLARFQEGVALLKLKRAVDAEEKFDEFLRLAAHNNNVPPLLVIEARDKLRYIYEVELRFEARRKVVATSIAAGSFDRLDLMKYCFPGLLRWNGPEAVSWLEGFYRQQPKSFRLRVALARYRTGQGRLRESEKILKECLRERPQDLRATAALLECLRERADWDRMAKIVAGLPAPSGSDPWLLLRLRGHVHYHRRQYQRAAECFELALQSDPASAEASLGLARACGALHQTERRERLLKKAQVLARIQNRTGRIQGSREPEAFLEVARLCEQIDLHEYALLWAWWAHRTDPADSQAKKLLAQLRDRYPAIRLPGKGTR